MLFKISHHGTRYNDSGFAEEFCNAQIVDAYDAEALVEWVTKVMFPLHDRLSFDPDRDSVTIATFAPTTIYRNTMQLEGSSKWMTGGTGGTSALWSTDFDPEHNANAIKHIDTIILRA